MAEKIHWLAEFPKRQTMPTENAQRRHGMEHEDLAGARKAVVASGQQRKGAEMDEKVEVTMVHRPRRKAGGKMSKGKRTWSSQMMLRNQSIQKALMVESKVVWGLEEIWHYFHRRKETPVQSIQYIVVWPLILRNWEMEYDNTFQEYYDPSATVRYNHSNR